MNPGALIIILAGAAMLVGIIAFHLAANGRERFFSLGQTAYHYFVVLTALASILLFYYFLSGDYSYRYVFEYSSSDLPLFYLISSFWAGQQGTYLLWLFMLALLGYFLLRRAGELKARTMFFYGLVNLFFCVMLIVVSPFEKLPVAQLEGAGLNPLLQDPWMVIHPPVIFLGYAAVALPFCLALAALIEKKTDKWIGPAFGPAALAAVALAAGNIMGGFWAYKTLGWGGYWSWDPVENSSFIPWMTSLALVHGIIVQKSKNSLPKTNILLALFSFLLVIYGTFLTRSGVLADFSVHSFVDLGVNQYLIGFMILSIIFSIGLFLFRLRTISGPSINLSADSREFALVMSIWMLSLIAILVLAGTSWPLLTTVFGTPGTADPQVYTRVTFPLAVIISLLLGLSPYMLWEGLGTVSVLKKAIIPAIVALILTALSVWIGLDRSSYVFFIFAAAFAFMGNLIIIKKYLPGRLLRAGAPIAHLGLALMLIGILGSSAYSTDEQLVLDRDESGSAFGYKVTYRGLAGEITEPHNEILLDLEYDGQTSQVRPQLYWSQRLRGMMKKPFIRRYPAYDLYLAPENIEEYDQDNGIRLIRGETTFVDSLRLKFIDFQQSSHVTGGAAEFGAILEISRSGIVDTLTPALAFKTGSKMVQIDKQFICSDDTLTIRLEGIYADDAGILISIPGITPESPPDRLFLEISRKPTMNLLWGGAIILVLGGCLSAIRRFASKSSVLSS